MTPRTNASNDSRWRLQGPSRGRRVSSRVLTQKPPRGAHFTHPTFVGSARPTIARVGGDARRRGVSGRCDREPMDPRERHRPRRPREVRARRARKMRRRRAIASDRPLASFRFPRRRREKEGVNALVRSFTRTGPRSPERSTSWRGAASKTAATDSCGNSTISRIRIRRAMGFCISDDPIRRHRRRDRA